MWNKIKKKKKEERGNSTSLLKILKYQYNSPTITDPSSQKSPTKLGNNQKKNETNKKTKIITYVSLTSYNFAFKDITSLFALNNYLFKISNS